MGGARLLLRRRASATPPPFAQAPVRGASSFAQAPARRAFPRSPRRAGTQRAKGKARSADEVCGAASGRQRPGADSRRGSRARRNRELGLGQGRDRNRRAKFILGARAWLRLRPRGLDGGGARWPPSRSWFPPWESRSLRGAEELGLEFPRSAAPPGGTRRDLPEPDEQPGETPETQNLRVKTENFPPFHHVSPRDRTYAVRHGGTHHGCFPRGYSWKRLSLGTHFFWGQFKGSIVNHSPSVRNWRLTLERSDVLAP
ncbi:hypothetical protein NN561_002978 [Cricetulus griseus]